ncbi:MAG: hypothetical protein JEY99_06255 [Spirochaetales bacterium]|nr:hypothetical protein [Spirochaetales bacterium]
MFFNGKRKIPAILGMFLIVVMLFSCASSGSSGSGASRGGSAVQAPTDKPMFYGYGRADSAMKAMNLGKAEAVRKAANAMLGVAVAMVKQPELDKFFSEINDFNIYVYPETTVKVSSGQDDQGFYSQIGVRVNLAALGNSLKAQMLLGGQVVGQAGETYSLADEPAPPGAKEEAVAEKAPEKGSEAAPEPAPAVEPARDVVADATAEELAFINDYLSDLTYMVYYNEDLPIDPFLMKSAVVSANRYLNQQGLSYVDLEQIESLKKDQAMVYEEETGEAVSIIQWIAHKLNADIYIEINLNVTERTDGGKYYGSANLTLNNYEASTAEGRGAANYQTNPPAFSTVSVDDALNNAVASAVYKAMPNALNSADVETRKALTRGLKYSLTIVNTQDRRLLRDFERKLERRIRGLKQLSYSAEQTVYEVYMLGDIIDLEDIIYDVTDTIPELSGMTLVMQQRSSMTFDSGI